MILILGATGMFGSRVLRETAARGASVRALVHSDDHAAPLRASGIDAVVGDLDDRASLAPAFAGVDTVFVVTPMDGRILERETNALDAAVAAGVRRIVKLYGAVRHLPDEPLDQQHKASIAAIAASGLRYALVSPNSVMETSFLSQAPAVQQANRLFGCAGDGRVGVVAADDVARAIAVVLTDRDEQGENYVLTGPSAITMSDEAAALTRLLGRPIAYQDMPDTDFRAFMVNEVGIPDDRVDEAVMVHFAAWKRGDADIVTDTVEQLTGTAAMSIDEWLAANRSVFSG
ncbi:NmrA family NAD(P)-binding protein [Herbiconiux sp. L3-i23]|uniref:NmrA family NAD(P)-binding protein n=1 Tax=Herbiconiux sp. L3-i23 TaxID=2905871 RepID=UPI002051D99C|nr:NmrA family NAD(P)-binding protein [Herbiconiux sp. L3-i23]BDI23321.1 nucleotide-diphosphate-sugar epimerase [Herbiconiux sp. L3-i23]